MGEMKYCSGCGPQAIHLFIRNKTKSDGLDNYCKDCRRLIRQEYYARHGADIRRRNRERYAEKRK